MAELLGAWFNGLSSGQTVFLFLLVAGTIMLVRLALHPTLFAVVAWPGTVAHELAHALVGFILLAKPREFSLWPKKLGDGQWQLGSVGFVGLTWWNSPWTALAPLLLAPLAVFLAAEWAWPVWEAGDALGGAWRLGLCVLFLQASVPSSTDLKVAAPGLAVLALLAAWLW